MFLTPLTPTTEAALRDVHSTRAEFRLAAARALGVAARPLAPQGEAVRAAYTAVLKGFLAMLMLRFPAGTYGHQIDAFARRALWDLGLDYDHGTGHGVGHLGAIHEVPHRFTRGANLFRIEAGLVLTVEPPAATGVAAIVLHNRTGGTRNSLKKVYDKTTTAKLAALAGKACNGRWTLKVKDAAAQDSGTLATFSVRLVFAQAGAPPAAPPPGEPAPSPPPVDPLVPLLKATVLLISATFPLRLNSPPPADTAEFRLTVELMILILAVDDVAERLLVFLFPRFDLIG